MSDTKEWTLVCEYCGETFKRAVRGGQAKFCSAEHRKANDVAKARVVRDEHQRAKAARAAEIDAWAQTICTKDHRTWSAKARCLWPGMQIVGEGPWAAWCGGTQITLYGTRAQAAMESPGAQIVRLRRGIHRTGQGVKK